MLPLHGATVLWQDPVLLRPPPGERAQYSGVLLLIVHVISSLAIVPCFSSDCLEETAQTAHNLRPKYIDRVTQGICGLFPCANMKENMAAEKHNKYIHKYNSSVQKEPYW